MTLTTIYNRKLYINIMARTNQKLINYHSSGITEPSSDNLNLGEIAVQHNSTEPKLYIKDNDNNIVSFVDKTYIDTIGSAVTEIESYIPSGTTSTDNQLTNKLYVDQKIATVTTEHTVNVQNMTDTTATIAPNTFYIWGEMTELDITLADPADTTIYNEYMFQFTSGDIATTLTLPDDLTWYLDNNIILANRTYQVSIVNNLAVLGEF